ncbi:MAG: hypothetical protein HKN86_02515 [Acidimicrobiia bacterium]|nr:hypothetical protein [Acidimicrobiia bacterium]
MKKKIEMFDYLEGVPSLINHVNHGPGYLEFCVHPDGEFAAGYRHDGNQMSFGAVADNRDELVKQVNQNIQNSPLLVK